MLCDCPLHPDHLPRCCPTRGGFKCGGQYRMPPLPDGMECQHFTSPFQDFSGLALAPGATDKLGALWGFRRRYAWETEKAYRQSFLAYLATR